MLALRTLPTMNQLDTYIESNKDRFLNELLDLVAK